MDLDLKRDPPRPAGHDEAGEKDTPAVAFRRLARRAAAGAAACLHRARAWTETGRARAAARVAARIGRAGYVAKGGLYALVGVLAVDAGVRPYDPAAGARGALLAVREQWMGQVLVALLAAGLAGYASWQLAQAVLDPLRRARGIRGLGFRAVCVVSAALYGALAWQAARLLAGARVDPEQRRRAVAWMRIVLEQPLGRWALLLVGLGVLAYAAAQAVRAVRGPARSLDLSDVPPATRRRVVWLAGAGLAARGVVAAVIAWFILRASVLDAPGELVGVAGALRVLRGGGPGPALLVVMGAGLVAYGILQVLRARYWDEVERQG